MSYKLEQPFTDFERADFVVLHNAQNGRYIYETDDCIYALEPNEMVQDGEVVINPNYEQEVLEQVKADKILENDNLRDIALLQGVTYSNVLFDSDTEQKTNLTAKYLMMSDEDTVTWFGMDNKALLCTKQDLLAIGNLIDELHTFCWENNAYIKGQIADAETLEQLEEIDISYDRVDN